MVPGILRRVHFPWYTYTLFMSGLTLITGAHASKDNGALSCKWYISNASEVTR